MCDLCYYLLGRHAPETTLHIVQDCPFSQPVVMAIWRAGFMPVTQPGMRSQINDMNVPQFLTAFQRCAIFGVAAYDPPEFRPPKYLAVPMGVLAAVTNAVLLRRRNNNAHCPDKPLQYDTQTSVARIIQTVADVATAMRVTATREEDRNTVYTQRTKAGSLMKKIGPQ